MKKIIVILLVTTFLCFNAIGQEFNHGVGNGGFWIMKEGMAGGYGEFSFPLHDESNVFVLRDCINIGGFGSTAQKNTGGLLVGNKILIGGSYCNSLFIVRNYGFIGSGFGMFGCMSHKPFNTPFLVSTILGGGMEFQYSKNNAFVIEFGGDMDLVVGRGRKDFSELAGCGPILMLGFRSYR